MGSIRVITWNVLHRIHAMNWKEPVIEGFPDERVRIEAISTLVSRWFAEGVAVVCLQEVSGDQRQRLVGTAGGEVTVFDHVYRRVPCLRAGGDAPLTEPAEHLVTLVNGPAQKISGQTFDADPGKGFLVVDVGDRIRVVNTHVTFGDRAAAELALVAAAARDPARAAVVVGDFNAPAALVAAALGEAFAVSDLAGQGATRVAASGHPGKVIDHVAVASGALEGASILDNEGLSDHRPVEATLRLGR